MNATATVTFTREQIQQTIVALGKQATFLHEALAHPQFCAKAMEPVREEYEAACSARAIVDAAFRTLQ